MKGRRGTGGSGCSVNSVVYDYEWIRTLAFVIFLWSGIFWFLSFAKFTTEICWEATWIKMRAALGKNHENFLNFWEHDENLIAKTSIHVLARLSRSTWHYNNDVACKLFAGGGWRIQKGGFRSTASRMDLWRREESLRNLSPCMETQGHPTIQSLQNPLTNLIERYGPVIIGFLGLWIVIFVRE